jgi:hypothetical protein
MIFPRAVANFNTGNYVFVFASQSDRACAAKRLARAGFRGSRSPFRTRPATSATALQHGFAPRSSNPVRADREKAMPPLRSFLKLYLVLVPVLAAVPGHAEQEADEHQHGPPGDA